MGKTKLIIITARLTLILLIVLVLWVVLMIASGSNIQPDWMIDDYLNYALEQDIIFVLNYLNAIVFTALVIILFGLLYLLMKDNYPLLTFIGLLFVPIYGMMNMIAYGSQVTVVPILGARNLDPEYLIQWIQIYPGSVIGMLNGLAYTLLGLPSILFALALHRRGFLGQITGDLLILNAVLCLLGSIGVLTGNRVLMLGTVAGGFVFTLAVLTLYLMLRKERMSL